MSGYITRGRGGSITRSVPAGVRPFPAGRKVRAVCPRCREWIKPGEMVKPAAGIGRVLKHTSCRKAG